MKKKKKQSPLYVGKKTYGDLPIEDAFKKALSPYFSKEDHYAEKKIG